MPEGNNRDGSESGLKGKNAEKASQRERKSLLEEAYLVATNPAHAPRFNSLAANCPTYWPRQRTQGT